MKLLKTLAILCFPINFAFAVVFAIKGETFFAAINAFAVGINASDFFYWVFEE